MSAIPLKYDLSDLIDNPQTFSGVLIHNAGANKFQLPNEVAFFRNTFRLNTRSDESGLNVTGVVFEEESVSLSDFWGRPVYRKIKIIDPLYQIGTIYAFGEVAGSIIGAEDINRAQAQISDNADQLINHNARLTTLENSEFKARQTNNGYLFGLTLSNSVSSPTDKVSVARGKAASAASFEDPAIITLLTSLEKKLLSPWSPGAGENGLDVGTVLNNSWYGVFLIDGASGADIMFSLSSTPALPENYAEYRRIGYVRTDGAGAIVPFNQRGSRFAFSEIRVPLSALVVATSPTLYALDVPPLCVAYGIISAGGVATGSTLAVTISSGIGAGQSAVAQTTGARHAFRGVVGGSHASGSFSADLKVWASYFEVQTDNQGRAYLSRAGSYDSGQGSTVQLHGWIDDRLSE